MPMKLAEALLNRSAMQNEIAQLQSRVVKNAVVQEGEEPVEDANRLLDQLIQSKQQLTTLILRIQRTNALTPLLDQSDQPMENTIQDGLVKRDGLLTLAETLRQIGGEAVPEVRYSRTEIKWIPRLEVAAIQRKSDELSKKARELDVLIQKTNWSVDLLD